jgi:CDP-diacylglycerol--glycerol-3-phosphate 3-phosphatidyltransferase/cardiolipin synthase
MSRVNDARRALPSLVSASRMAAAPLLHDLIVSGRFRDAAILLGCAAASDLADGALARRLGAVMRAGAWIDVTADFTFVATGLVALAAVGATPAWVPLLAGLMFAQFVVTSWRGGPAYDPIGKYYGGFLYGVLAVVLLVPDLAVWHAAPVVVAAMTAASLGSRMTRRRENTTAASGPTGPTGSQATSQPADHWRTTTSAVASSVSPRAVRKPRTR